MTTQTTTLPRSATTRLSKIGLLEALLAIIGFGISVIGAIEITHDPRLANQLALGIVIACSVFLTYQSVISFRAMWIRNPHNYGTVSQVDDDGTVVLVSDDDETTYTYIKVTDDAIIRSEKVAPSPGTNNNPMFVDYGVNGIVGAEVREPKSESDADHLI